MKFKRRNAPAKNWRVTQFCPVRPTKKSRLQQNKRAAPAGTALSSACDQAYSRSDRFQLMRSPSVVLLLDEEEDEPELLPFGDFSRSL